MTFQQLILLTTSATFFSNEILAMEMKEEMKGTLAATRSSSLSKSSPLSEKLSSNNSSSSSSSSDSKKDGDSTPYDDELEAVSNRITVGRMVLPRLNSNQSYDSEALSTFAAKAINKSAVLSIKFSADFCEKVTAKHLAKCLSKCLYLKEVIIVLHSSLKSEGCFTPRFTMGGDINDSLSMVDFIFLTACANCIRRIVFIGFPSMENLEKMEKHKKKFPCRVALQLPAQMPKENRDSLKHYDYYKDVYFKIRPHSSLKCTTH